MFGKFHDDHQRSYKEREKYILRANILFTVFNYKLVHNEKDCADWLPQRSKIPIGAQRDNINGITLVAPYDKSTSQPTDLPTYLTTYLRHELFREIKSTDLLTIQKMLKDFEKSFETQRQ